MLGSNGKTSDTWLGLGRRGAGHAAIGKLEALLLAVARAVDPREHRIGADPAVSDTLREVVRRILEHHAVRRGDARHEGGDRLAPRMRHVEQAAALFLDHRELVVVQPSSADAASHADHRAGALRHPLLFDYSIAAPHLEAPGQPGDG